MPIAVRVIQLGPLTLHVSDDPPAALCANCRLEVHIGAYGGTGGAPRSQPEKILVCPGCRKSHVAGAESLRELGIAR